MSLIICSECGKEISDKATACIHCGCPIKKDNSPHISKKFVYMCMNVDIHVYIYVLCVSIYMYIYVCVLEYA